MLVGTREAVDAAQEDAGYVIDSCCDLEPIDHVGHPRHAQATALSTRCVLLSATSSTRCSFRSSFSPLQ